MARLAVVLFYVLASFRSYVAANSVTPQSINAVDCTCEQATGSDCRRALLRVENSDVCHFIPRCPSYNTVAAYGDCAVGICHDAESDDSALLIHATVVHEYTHSIVQDCLSRSDTLCGTSYRKSLREGNCHAYTAGFQECHPSCFDGYDSSFRVQIHRRQSDELVGLKRDEL